LGILSKDISDDKRFDYISYNKWFDEMDIQSHIGSSNNLIQSYLEVPIQILMDCEKVGKSYISKRDQKKLLKALKLLQEIKLEKQQ